MMQELDERVVDRCESDFKHVTPLVLNSPMLKQMYKLYTRHAFEHILFQYMHSHYLVIESKENHDGSSRMEMGERQSMKIADRLKAGVYYVRDTNENIRYQVTVR